MIVFCFYRNTTNILSKIMSRNSTLIQRTIAFLPSAATSQAGSVDLAQKLALAVESLLTEREANEAALLCAIGMSKHPRLTVLRDRVLAEGKQTFDEIEALFKQNRFVDPESKQATHADAVLAWSAREAVDFVFDPSDRAIEYPSTNRWLESCLRRTPAFQRALHHELAESEVLDCDIPARIVRGEIRVGGMVDAKPVSTDARRAAEKVKELNKDYKKQQTQRQKEKEEAAAAVAAAPVAEKEEQGALQFTLGERIASGDADKINKCVEMVKQAVGLSDIQLVEHAPAMDAAELDQALSNVQGIKCKNLFLKCKKKRNADDASGLYLVCVPTDRQVDLKSLQKQLDLKDQLRFASQDTLTETLDVLQGSVTPFALVNDSEKLINIVLDEDMLRDEQALLWFHPLDNKASVGLPASLLVQFCKSAGRNPFILNLSGGGAAPAETKAQPTSTSKKSASRGAEGEKMPTKKPAPIDSAQVASTVAPPVAVQTAVAAPLVVALTHELAQDRLWARLEKLGVAKPKKLDLDQTGAQRPVGHDTHNLLVKDSKTKKLYLVTMEQSKQVDLKLLGEKLGCTGALRLAGPADVETAIALTKGCITPMWLFNNVQNTVTPVFDSNLLAEPERALVICAGCDSATDHTQHNVIQITTTQILQLINDGAAREHQSIAL